MAASVGPRIAGKRRCRVYLELSLPLNSKVAITLKRGSKTGRKIQLTLPAGPHRIDLRRRFGTKRTIPGSYTATLVATASNIAGPPACARFKVPLRAK